MFYENMFWNYNTTLIEKKFLQSECSFSLDISLEWIVGYLYIRVLDDCGRYTEYNNTKNRSFKIWEMEINGWKKRNYI